VHDVESAAAEQRRKAAHTKQIPFRPPIHGDVRDACRVERLDEWSWKDGPGSADRDLEALTRQVRCQADEKYLRSAPAVGHAIGKQEEAQSLCGRAHG